MVHMHSKFGFNRPRTNFLVPIVNESSKKLRKSLILLMLTP